LLLHLAPADAVEHELLEDPVLKIRGTLDQQCKNDRPRLQSPSVKCGTE
jgi:hypothetical protein